MCVGLGALFLRVIRWSRYLSCTHVHFCPSRTHLTVRVPFCGVILRPPYTPSLYAFLLLEFVVELCSARSQSRFSMCHLGLSALSSAFAGQPFSPPPPIPHDMGCTTTPLGCDGPEIGKSSSVIFRAVRRPPPTRSHKSLDPDVSKASRRRLRQTKSYTLPHKKRQTATDIVGFSPERGSVISFFPGGSPKRDWTPVCFFMQPSIYAS